MSIFTTRPLIMGTKAVVAAGHYLAAVAGMRILERGGNAIDSAAAIGFSLAVLEAHMNSIGGEVPMLIYVAKEERVEIGRAHVLTPVTVASRMPSSA